MAGKWLVQVLVRSWVDGSFKIGRSGLSTCPQSVSATWPTDGADVDAEVLGLRLVKLLNELLPAILAYLRLVCG